MSRDLSAAVFLRQIQRELLSTLPARVGEVESGWRELTERRTADPPDDAAALDERLRDLHRLAHSLHGEGTTFGFEAMALAASELERRLKEALDAGGVSVLGSDGGRSIEQQIAEVRRVASGYDENHMPDLPSRFGTGQVEGQNGQTPPQVYLVDDDRDLARAIGVQLRHYGYTVTAYYSLEQAKMAIETRRPDAVVMDIMFGDDDLAGTEAWRALRATLDDPPPVLFVSARDDLEARLHATRAGGVAYFTKPLDVGTLADRLDLVTGRRREDPFEILIVDDDELVARHHARILQRAGMTTTVLVEPLDLLQKISEIRPDLLLLDVYFPGCTGAELAAMLRQHESWLSIPIVFLSTEADPKEQRDALARGGDEFLTKPVDAETLLAAVEPRARRGRLVGSLIERDGLTGLINHSQHQQRLRQEVARASRDGSTLCFAMIDVDDFKGVNDSWGHAVGDRVLRSLAGILGKRLRASDVVSRYGGDEFAVLLPATGERAAERLMSAIGDAFAQLSHAVGEARFSVTMSCGIASYPRCPDAESLALAADRALYEVKRRGKGGVQVHNG